MTLVRVERIRDWDSILVHRRHDFIRLSLLDSGIVGDVTDQKRFLNMGQRGTLNQHSPALFGVDVGLPSAEDRFQRNPKST